MYKVFISTSSFAEYDRTPLDILESSGILYQLNPQGRKLQFDECVKLYKGIDGLIAGTEMLTYEILKNAGKLKVISRCGTGLDNVDLQAARNLGIKVFNTPDIPTQAVAELTLGLILNLLRLICREDMLVKTGRWEKHMGGLLRGKTLGVLGMGRIGKKVVELSSTFEMKYLAWDISPDLDFASRYKVAFAELGEVLAGSDILTIHLPYLPGLKNIIGSDQLRLMKKEAYLVNAARGGLVDEDALAEALREKQIAGAAVDVFENEPYSGPLTGLENAILTPHIGSYTRETRIDMEVQAVQNLLRGLKEYT